MLKDFVVKFGRMLWDIGAWFVLIFIGIYGLCALFSSDGMIRLSGLLTLLIGPIICVIAWQFVYIFFDIRDKLEELVELKKQEMNIEDIK